MSSKDKKLLAAYKNGETIPNLAKIYGVNIPSMENWIIELKEEEECKGR